MSKGHSMAMIVEMEESYGTFYGVDVHYPVGEREKMIIADIQLCQVLLKYYCNNLDVFDENYMRVTDVKVDGIFSKEMQRAIRAVQFTNNLQQNFITDSGLRAFCVVDGRISPIRTRKVAWREGGKNYLKTLFVLEAAMSEIFPSKSSASDWIFTRLCSFPVEPLQSTLKEYVARPVKR